MIERLALGTVQFGLPYGIANQTGQVSRDEVAAILEYAQLSGVDTLDTAMAYGESEKCLGKAGIADWRVVSKLPVAEECCPDVSAWVRESVADSLGRLSISRLYGLLLHRSDEFLAPHGDRLYRAMLTLKNTGIVEKIGVSVYEPDELEALCSRFHFDLVQVPFNILDHRFATSGWFDRMKQAGTEIHVRSIFLQGLLLMDKDRRPAYFERWGQLWQLWEAWLDERGLTPLQACVGHALSYPEIDRVLVGVESLKQIKEILSGAKVEGVVPPKSLTSNDGDLINPSHWSMC